MRNLDMENKAIIDYAKTLCFKQIILDKQPKLQKIDKAVNSLDPSVSKKSKNEKLKHNHSLETASKIVIKQQFFCKFTFHLFYITRSYLNKQHQ
jgi:hypothetical protein